jgi:hypothetical protein
MKIKSLKKEKKEAGIFSNACKNSKAHTPAPPPIGTRQGTSTRHMPRLP